MSNAEVKKTSSATWDAMTDQQKIEWLAMKVMQWKRYEPNRDTRGVSEPCFTVLRFGGGKELLTADYGGKTSVQWNPLTDWNHTMEVVERLRRSHQVDLCFAENSPKFNVRIPKEGTATEFTVNVTSEEPRHAICKAAYLSLQ